MVDTIYREVPDDPAGYTAYRRGPTVPTITSATVCAGGNHVILAFDDGRTEVFDLPELLGQQEPADRDPLRTNIRLRCTLDGCATAAGVLATLGGAVFR